MESRRIIKISQNKIYITPEYYFLLEETTLPTVDFSFKSKEDFYWEIEITSFEKTTRILTVKVIDYYPSGVERFVEQEVKTHIDLLRFEPFEWKALEPFLGLYRKNDLLRHLWD